MKKWTELLLAVLFGLLLPMLALGLARPRHREAPASGSEPVGQTEETQTPAQPLLLRVYFPDAVRELELETYLTGAVLGEMPTDFEAEALMAQAVVARTYALQRYSLEDKHPGGVCTDSTCCQAYCTPEEYLASGGSQEELDNIMTAVASTAGQVLTYDGELIEATYFSCSGGRTEAAAAVWGQTYPYLQAVDSPGEEQAPRYTETRRFTVEEVSQALGQSLSGRWLGAITYTDGGGVATIRLGEETYTGTDIRSRLGLSSTAFVITAVGDTVTVTTKGFGHRVGMSQYGAEAMAVGGSTCGEILAHYYPGTALQSWQAD